MRPDLYGSGPMATMVGTVETAMNGPNPYFERAREYDAHRTQESVDRLQGELHELDTQKSDPPANDSPIGEFEEGQTPSNKNDGLSG
jgi:hypothetical protein